jgi:uncharacterized protein YecE (DUF72 family)
MLEAYERNHRKESLIQYLSALRLLGYEVIYREKLEEYEVNDEIRDSLDCYMKQIREEAEQSQSMADIISLRQMKEKGQMLEYYQKTEELLEAWKTEIRRK